MQNIVPNRSPEAINDKNYIEMHRFFLSLVITGILYFSVGGNRFYKNISFWNFLPNHNTLPEAVINTVLTNLSQVGVSENISIVNAEKRVWSDTCLGLPETGVICSQTQILGWEIVVKSEKESWVYRISENGDRLKLDIQAAKLIKAAK